MSYAAQSFSALLILLPSDTATPVISTLFGSLSILVKRVDELGNRKPIASDYRIAVITVKIGND